MAKSEMELRMEQDQCMEALDEAIREVEAQLEQLGDTGSEALDTGDQGLIDQVMEGICYITEQLTALKSLKVSAKLQVITARISNTMVGVLTTVGQTSAQTKMPNARKIRKIQEQLMASTLSARQARKEIQRTMRSASPSRAALTDDQRAQAMLYIQSRHVSRTGGLADATADVWSRASAERGTPQGGAPQS